MKLATVSLADVTESFVKMFTSNSLPLAKFFSNFVRSRALKMRSHNHCRA